ncbi:hypothetical protein TA3x_003772 [Tundrisphaera sp. TA3]|uniref:hypothetical protein n=1 Tax=Tundrisphaera sp. TA3 TaxID=3435775 RepID=UPI003EBB6907
MDCPAPLLAGFPPSPDLLFEVVRRSVDDMMLWEIVDFGARRSLDRSKVMAELRLLRDAGAGLAPISLDTCEALESTRNCDPDRPNPPPCEPRPTGRRGHQARLFACALLLHPDSGELNPDVTLVRSLESARVLGDEAGEALARFLTWRLDQGGPIWPEPLLVPLSLLILATRLRVGRFDDSALGAISGWFLETEACEHREFALWPPMSFLQGLWRPFAAELTEAASSVDSACLRDDLMLCAIPMDPDP